MDDMMLDGSNGERVPEQTEDPAGNSLTDSVKVADDLGDLVVHIRHQQRHIWRQACKEQTPLVIEKIKICQMKHEVEQKPWVDFLTPWNQWQLLDSVLPTGGFAHSYGLEAAIQTRFVGGPENLKKHVIQVLDNTGSLLLPFVYCANISPSIETWCNLDRMLEAALTNEVSRKASTSQGSALLRVATAVFPEINTLKQLRGNARLSGVSSFHHAPIFGLVCGLLGFDSKFSQQAYMFITMRDVLSAATRLNLVGPLGAAALQHQIASTAENLVEKWMDRRIDEACQTCPLLDTVQGCHGYLFTRLFSS